MTAGQVGCWVVQGIHEFKGHHLLVIHFFSSSYPLLYRSSKPLPLPDKMTFVDQSNTNWTPWPRLANVPQRAQVVGGVATIMFSAFLMMQWRRRSGTKPITMSKEWREATEKESNAKPTESGADPVVMNPISKAMRDRSSSK